MPVLRLPNGTHLDGDRERIYVSLDEEQAGGDGVYAADVAEATGLPEEQVRTVLEQLVADDVLTRLEHADPTYGPRYLRSRGA